MQQVTHTVFTHSHSQQRPPFSLLYIPTLMQQLACISMCLLLILAVTSLTPPYDGLRVHIKEEWERKEDPEGYAYITLT